LIRLIVLSLWGAIDIDCSTKRVGTGIGIIISISVD
jgi:hypothetical protein